MSLHSRPSGLGHDLTIGFVRRGFSSGGGAEAFLKRLAAGVVEKGYGVVLFTAGKWPEDAWDFGPIKRIEATSALAFADALEKLRPGKHCDVLLSLERIWRCDVYRAGDGVHRAWLERRKEFAGSLQKISRLFNRKHSGALALEESLFAKGGAKRVIANSRMVKDEIVQCYRYPADRIEVVYNGLPLAALERDRVDRAKTRNSLRLGEDEIAVLFAGSGWERKGLGFAIQAVEAQDKRFRLLVAGRGEPRKFRSPRLQFLGVVHEMPSLYHAADIFLLPTVYDPFSNACLEALAAGRPVITTRANGFSEIIENERHGTILESAGDVNAISNALQFWSDPARRAQAQVDNLALAAQFDMSRNVDETLQVLMKAERNTDL
ncbi:MAG TPA: glycosyltransferase family 4 protein [Chthoniobacterales bacterium]|nr:glycosyltransferase family 4 protein [Chthoniobacterales bacterium]